MLKKIILFILVAFLPASVLASELIPRVDFQDASVIDIISSLAKKEKINLIVSGDQAGILSKKATVHLENVYPREVIKYVLESSELDYAITEDLLFVSSIPQGMEKTSVITLKYLGSEKVLDLLVKVMPQIKISTGEKSNSLILKGKWRDIDEAEKLLASLDSPAPQILIESKVVEIAQSDSLKFGLMHEASSIGAFTFITDKTTRKTTLSSDINSTLNALLVEGRANIVANPRIATLDNQEALINIGSRIPYAVPVSSSSTATQWRVEYIDAGINLKIIPRVRQDEMITIKIQPEVSSISEWRTTPAGDFPVISTRNVSATLRVKNGETIVVGGLISEAEREHVARIPVLGQIPIVGLLFQNRGNQKEKTEIVFLITPHLI